jgi:ATP-dependent protease ClpP protease subunit
MKYNITSLLLANPQWERKPVNLVQNASEASLYVYDVISADWGVSAMQIVDAIAQAGDAKTLNIYINSPGGDVFESRAIMAAIDRFPGKTVAHIDSLCASAATSIASLLLQTIELSIIKDYTDKTGKPDEEIIAMMDAETWMTADAAKQNGFIDNVIEAKSKAKNTWNLSAFSNPPPEPETEAPEPALPAGFFMSEANANRLRLASI